ncbi:MAG: hypothetical protein HZA01_02425 [Nitrospinae bacterium]|nr:hypothetical protein [Nitrospinota bacterium]
MPAREMEQYLNEKLGCFLKILAIVQEQQNFIQDKNLDRFKIYIVETSKLIEKIKELDNRHKDALEEWNSGKLEISKKASAIVDGLVARIRETIEKISKIQPEQIKHFLEEKRLLEEEVVKIRQDRKLFAGYKDAKKSTGLLDIKK